MFVRAQTRVGYVETFQFDLLLTLYRLLCCFGIVVSSAAGQGAVGAAVKLCGPKTTLGLPEKLAGKTETH